MENSTNSSIFESRRLELLEGKCHLPAKLFKILKIKEEKKYLVEEMWDSCFNNFLKEKACDSWMWMDRLGQKRFNKVIKALSEMGWLVSRLDKNYASFEINEDKILKYISKGELQNIRYNKKWLHYVMRKEKSQNSKLVKSGNIYRESGLVREGFEKAGNNKFFYDTKYIRIYEDYIAANILKGLGASQKDITYEEIVKCLTDWYAIDGSNYTLGQCYPDSRGRAIFKCTSRVFNPVSHKDARAVVKLPYAVHLDVKGQENIFAFISELNGYRGLNWADKVDKGKEFYGNKEMPDMEKMDETNDYSSLHEYIWLERIYEHLDKFGFKKWDIPIEIDALASAVEIIGLLTNDYELLDKTNIINPNEYKDIWKVDYVSRLHVKKAIVPILYGSSQHPKDLWDAHKLEYTDEQLRLMGKDLLSGTFMKPRKFKDFIINNVKTEETMYPNIWGEKFSVQCNRYKWDESVHEERYIYVTSQEMLRPINRNVTLVPDLNQFKTFWVTGLIHNLDSQICNHICKNLDWILPNHDAFTLHPNDADRCRKLYLEQIQKLYKDRKNIMNTFCSSIGITEPWDENNPELDVNEFSGECLK